MWPWHAVLWARPELLQPTQTGPCRFGFGAAELEAGGSRTEQRLAKLQRHARCNSKRIRCNMQRVTCNMQHAVSGSLSPSGRAAKADLQRHCTTCSRGTPSFRASRCARVLEQHGGRSGGGRGRGRDAAACPIDDCRGRCSVLNKPTTSTARSVPSLNVADPHLIPAADRTSCDDQATHGGDDSTLATSN